ncbi:receptor L domain-containing protein [Paraliomyxa miuraensis]|uniref:hypothetical protein n=1 Tax=Paraliomyxa miuraensis TaxID=376150 RepID=UPI002254D14B|nr:hypothetical protein [Paraliomyxa miuraensis]
MKSSNLMMGVLAAGSMALLGCPADEPPSSDESTGPAGSSSSGEPETSTGPGTTSTDATTASVDDTAGSSSGEPEPWPEFPCEGADQVLDANVLIQSADDLAQLDGVREITRSLVIDSTDLVDLDALGCIDLVGENLQIFGNTSLTNVDGLVNLTAIGGTFIFSDNTALTDFDGLQSLTRIDGSFSFTDNEAVTQISGFDSLVGIEGDVTIRTNESLTNIDGLKGLMVVGGVLAITANPMLCISSVNCVGEGIVSPPSIPPDWTTVANDDEC